MKAPCFASLLLIPSYCTMVHSVTLTLGPYGRGGPCTPAKIQIARQPAQAELQPNGSRRGASAFANAFQAVTMESAAASTEDLPAASVARVVKAALPSGMGLRADGRTALSMSASVFIAYLTAACVPHRCRAPAPPPLLPPLEARLTRWGRGGWPRVCLGRAARTTCA